MNRRIGLILAALVLLPAAVVALAIAAATPEQKCLAAKLKEVGKYDACLFKAYATQVIKGLPSPDTSKCDSKFATNWAKPETKYGAECPTSGDQTTIAATAVSHVASVFASLSGAAAAVCGDGSIGAGEECDGAELGGATCSSVGFDSGTLACDGSCQFDTSGCVVAAVCGNGVIEGSEECDGAELGGATCSSVGFDGGTLACDGSCAYDTSACTLAP